MGTPIGQFTAVTDADLLTYHLTAGWGMETILILIGNQRYPENGDDFRLRNGCQVLWIRVGGDR